MLMLLLSFVAGFMVGWRWGDDAYIWSKNKLVEAYQWVKAKL